MFESRGGDVEDSNELEGEALGEARKGGEILFPQSKWEGEGRRKREGEL